MKRFKHYPVVTKAELTSMCNAWKIPLDVIKMIPEGDNDSYLWYDIFRWASEHANDSMISKFKRALFITKINDSRKSARIG